MSPRDILFASIIVLVWGFNFVALKVSVTEFPPLLLSSMRFFLVFLLLSPWVVKVPRAELKTFLWLSSLFGVGYFGLLYIGMRHVPAGESSIIAQLQVPFSTLFAAWFYKEKVDKRTIAGIIIAFAGVMVTIGMPQRAGSLVAVLLIVIATVMTALAFNKIKQFKNISPLTINATLALFAFPQLVILTLFFEPNALYQAHWASWQGYAALMFSVVASTIVCYSLWFYLLRKYPVNRVVPFSLAVPVFGVLSSSLFMHEAIRLHMLLGCVIAVFGLALIVVRA